jgi:hypothetical protein
MKSFLKIEDLLVVAITWSKTSGKPHWPAMVGKDPCELAMNEFPEEPLYTLHWQARKVDFDDAPHHWKIPRG